MRRLNVLAFCLFFAIVVLIFPSRNVDKVISTGQTSFFGWHTSQSKDCANYFKGYPLIYEKVSADCQKSVNWLIFLADMVILAGFLYFLAIIISMVFKPEKPSYYKNLYQKTVFKILIYSSGFLWYLTLYLAVSGFSLKWLIATLTGAILTKISAYLTLKKWKNKKNQKQFSFIIRSAIVFFSVLLLANLILIIGLVFSSQNIREDFSNSSLAITVLIILLFIIIVLISDFIKKIFKKPKNKSNS